MDCISWIFAAFNEGTVLAIIVLPMHFSRRLFWVKYIVRHVIEACKSGMACFSCLSLLLSTTVLNDIYIYNI